MAERIIKRILIMAIIFLLIIPIYAEAAHTDNIRDYMNYLSQAQIDELQAMIESAVQEYNLDIAIVITDDTQGKSSMEFADDYYDSNGFGTGSDYSGLLMLINMQERDVWISTTGKAISIFTDSRIDSVLDAVVPFLSDDRYYDACRQFINEVIVYAGIGPVKDYNNGTGYQNGGHGYYDGYPWGEPQIRKTYLERVTGLMTHPAVYIFSLVVAIIATLVVSSQNKGRMTVTDRTYEEEGSFRLNKSDDIYLRETTTRVRVASSNNTRAMGSKPGGRSSVHRSSSGRAHGGGGRKF